MDLKLKGKCVIVTGGSKGIGLAIAEEFAKEGAAVSICARGQENLDKARELIEKAGGTVHAKTCDVSDPIALQEYIVFLNNAFLKSAMQSYRLTDV